MNETWFDKTPEETAKILKTNAAAGLTRRAARVRLRKNGENCLFELPGARSKIPEYIKSVALDFTSLLLLVTVGIAWIFGRWESAAVLLAIWLCHLLLTSLTYVKSQQIFAAMQSYAVPEVCVLRQGRLSLADSRTLVPGDVIFLREGDMVPCDARVVSSESLTVVEADLFGTRTPVHKTVDPIPDGYREPAGQHNMVFAPATVVGGSGRAIVVATGPDTLIYQAKGPLPLGSGDELPLVGQIKKYCQAQSLFVLALIFVITVLDLLLAARGGGLFEVFLRSLCLAVASMSEMLWALGHIILARGLAGAALSAAKDGDGAIVQNIAKIETVGAVNCFVLDSGVLYDRARPEVAALYAGKKLYQASELAEGLKEAPLLTALVKGALAVSGALYGRGGLSAGPAGTGDGEALAALARSAGLDLAAAAGEFPLLERCPAGGGSLFETVLTGDAEGYTAFVRGEPAGVLARCVAFLDEECQKPLTPADSREFFGIEKRLREQGFRVYAVARSRTEYNNLRRVGAVQSELCFLGFVAQRERQNAGADAFVTRCGQAGIRLVLMHDGSGDDLVRLAAGCGIGRETGFRVWTAEKRESLNSAAYDCDLYAGLDAAGKASLVEALRSQGLTVGYVGHRLSDLRPMQAADVSFTPSLARYSTQKAKETKVTALTAGFCQALKRRADVLVAGSLAACVKAADYAASIYQNLQAAARYLVTIQLARVFLVVYSVLTGIWSVTATGILASGLIFDFGAVMVFAFEKPTRRKGKREAAIWRLAPVSVPAVAAALLWAVTVMALPAALRGAGLAMGERDTRTYAFLALLLTQLALVAYFRPGWRDAGGRFRLGPMLAGYFAATAAFVAAAAWLPPFGELFGVWAVTGRTLLPALCPPVVMVAALLAERVLRGGAPKEKE